MTLPSFSSMHHFSESMMNALSLALLACYERAVAPRVPFTREILDEDETWHGYIIHTSETFHYCYVQAYTGTVEITMGGNSIYSTLHAAGTYEGTIDITAQSFTVGQVYEVILSHNISWDSAVDVYWLGESKTINYTTPPTFTNGVTVTAANLETLRTCITELEDAADWPDSPFPASEEGGPGADNMVKCRGTNEYHVVYYGAFHHVHNTVRYWFRHGCSTKSVCTEIYLNGTRILKDEDSTFDRIVTGTVDISALGLTQGTIYPVEVRTQLNGTTHTYKIFCQLRWLAEESSTAATPPPVWNHGDQTIDKTNLDRYNTIINTIHPGAAAPAIPLYREQPAVHVSGSNRYWLRRLYRWLRYKRVAASKTVTVKYGPAYTTKTDLPSTTTNHQSFDLNSVPLLDKGQYYLIDDCQFVCEWTSSQ